MTFRVGQDQDYLNVLCRHRVRYLGNEWNTMPTGISVSSPSLIHYNLDAKPWQKDGVKYEEDFWHCAALSGFLPELKAIRAARTVQQQEKAAAQTRELIRTGYNQAMDREENARIRHRIRQVVSSL